MNGAAFSPPGQPITLAGPDAPVRLGRLLVQLALGAALFDACFWQIGGLGFSFPLFFAGLAALILVRGEGRPWRRTLRILLVLLAGAVAAGVIETGVANFFVLLALTIALAGEVFFGELESPWARWLAQGVAWVRAPGRAFWLGRCLMDAAFRGSTGWLAKFFSVGSMALLALLLVLIFGWLLASGNAVFGRWTGSFFAWLFVFLAKGLDPARLFFWGLAVVMLLPLLRPVRVSSFWWQWPHHLPRVPEWVPGRLAAGGSMLILALLNLLFLVANAADALFLWSGRALPPGVTYSRFVHTGTNSLTITVLLSAVVLTGIFQQAAEVARRTALKILALAWIAQNLFLLCSVVRRLNFYIQAYNLTVTRLSLIIFLILVAAGFGLLAIKILRDKSLSWLLGGGVLAVFATLYLTQFFNLAGWTANYNLAQWEKNPARTLDTDYLVALGPAAWPALHRLYMDSSPSFGGWDHGPRIEAISTENYTPRSSFDTRHWREFSLRAWWNRWALDEPK